MSIEDYALELGVTCEEVIDSLKKMGYNYKSKSDILDDEAIIMLDNELSKVEENNLTEELADKFELEDRAEEIKKFKEKGLVMMCGDGINDSVSLVTADIGVSVSSGTDIAMDSSNVVLMNDNLEKIEDLISISEKTIKNIKQNLFWAFFYNICMIPIACGVLEPLGVVMNPMIAAFAMTISSLTVVLNALRLKK